MFFRLDKREIELILKIKFSIENLIEQIERLRVKAHKESSKPKLTLNFKIMLFYLN